MPSMLVVNHLLPHYRMDVFRALQAREGWDVHFAAGRTSRDGSIAEVGKGDLASVHRLQNHWIGPGLWQTGLLGLTFRKWDHVIFLGDAAYISTWAAAAMARIRGSQVSFWTIGWHRREAGLKRVVRLLFYRLAHQLLLYGETGRSIGTQMGYPPERMTVIYNSSSNPPEHLHESESELRSLNKRLASIQGPAVGAVIRLNPHKQLHLLIAAVARANELGAGSISVVLAGDGPDRTRLKSVAAALGVDLHLVGPVYGPAGLRSFYERCLVTVLPTSAGLTVLQSLKHGRPVVTHDDPQNQMPEFEAILPGRTGDLYHQNDLDDLAQVIFRWVSAVQDDTDDLIAAACRTSLQSSWTAEASSSRIYDALQSAPQPGSATQRTNP